MRYKSVLFLILSLVFFLTFKLFLQRQISLINVQGRAEILSANIQKRDSITFSSRALGKSKILAVSGKVKSSESDLLIPLKILNRKKLITYTNSDGIFNFNLERGIYTFFILDEKNAYLNSFDGKGYYKFYKIYSEIDDILITVTSKSYF